MIETTGRLAWKKLKLNEKVDCPVQHIMTPLGADNFVLAQEWVNKIDGSKFYTILDTIEDNLMAIPENTTSDEADFIKVDAEPAQEIVQEEVKETKHKRKKRNVRSSESKKEAEEHRND